MTLAQKKNSEKNIYVEKSFSGKKSKYRCVLIKEKFLKNYYCGKIIYLCEKIIDPKLFDFSS